MIRIPDSRDAPVLGFAGQAGWLVAYGVEQPDQKEVLDMPRGDGTGPTGAGPGTGRMKGFCMGFDTLGTSNRPQDSAPQRRGGGRHGRYNRFVTTGLTGWKRSAGFGFGQGITGLPDSESTPELELEILKSQAGYLQKALDGIKRRMQKWESGGKQQV